MVFLFTMRSATNKFTKFKSTIMRNYIATAFLILSSIACFAQSDVDYFAWVYDASSYTTIEGATVTIQSNTGDVTTNKTDLDGEARFDGIVNPGVVYTITVVMDGYSSMETSFCAPKTSGQGFTGAEFYLSREED